MTGQSQPPGETPEQLRQRVERIDSKFFEDFEKRGGPFRDHGFEYEKLAIDYTHKVFQTLTYLNGGALVAIPTAMAFLRADVAKANVLLTAGAFVIGLLCIVLAEGCAFFTMAKRAEAQEEFRWEQFHRITATMFPQQVPMYGEHFAKSSDRHQGGGRKLTSSNIWRWAGLACFAGSLIAFVAGCGWGALTVMAAKDRTETRGPIGAE